MDHFDRQILSHLQKDSRLTAENISALVGLSSAAIQKRVKKLRDNKVIQKEIAVLDADKLGQSVTVLVEVYLMEERINILESFKNLMRNSPQVQQCYYTTGGADFILVVVVPDISAYEAFTKEYFFNSETVRKFKSSVVMSKVKVGLDIPVLDEV